MSFAAAMALTFFALSGIAIFVHGVGRMRRVVALHRTGVRVVATRLPDSTNADHGFAELPRPIHQRQARFHCPFLKQPRTVAEDVASSRQSYWERGQSVMVIVSTRPPHPAVVATVRNLYVFPLVYLATGCAMMLMPLAIVLA